MARRIIILHGSNDQYGASRLLARDAEALTAAGHEVVVVLPGPGPLTSLVREAGAEVVEESRLRVLRRVDGLKAIRIPRTLPTRVDAQDVVVVWTLALACYVPLLRLQRIPFMVSVHEILEGRLGTTLARLASSPGVPTMANSSATAEWLTRAGVSPTTIHVAYPDAPALSTTSKRPGNSDGPLRILVAGRINGAKGQREAILALAPLVDEGVNLHLVLAGGPFPGQEHHLERMLQAASGLDWVSYVGEVPDIGSLLKEAQILLIASVKPEAFGMVALEGWAAGCGVVAPREGGAAEAAMLVGGLTYEPRNDTSLRAAIRRCATSPDIFARRTEAQPAARICTQGHRLEVWRSLLAMVSE